MLWISEGLETRKALFALTVLSQSCLGVNHDHLCFIDYRPAFPRNLRIILMDICYVSLFHCMCPAVSHSRTKWRVVSSSLPHSLHSGFGFLPTWCRFPKLTVPWFGSPLSSIASYLGVKVLLLFLWFWLFLCSMPRCPFQCKSCSFLNKSIISPLAVFCDRQHVGSGLLKQKLTPTYLNFNIMTQIWVLSSFTGIRDFRTHLLDYRTLLFNMNPCLCFQ